MTIKEVSEKYGITQDTLRYYERIKVIPKVTRTAGGIRDYHKEDLKWVEHVICMRNAGLPIDRLSYKVSRYEEAMKTGKLVWKEGHKQTFKEILLRQDFFLIKMRVSKLCRTIQTPSQNRK